MLDRAIYALSGIVDQNIDPAELLQGRLDEISDGFGIAACRSALRMNSGNSFDSSSSTFFERAAKTTVAPLAARSCAVARPMPWEAPVMTMIFPFTFMSLLYHGREGFGAALDENNRRL